MKRNRRKLFQYAALPKLNPHEKAKEMVATFGAEKAQSIAQSISKGVTNALNNRDIMEFTCRKDLIRGNGLWQSVAGYAKKQAEKERVKK